MGKPANWESWMGWLGVWEPCREGTTLECVLFSWNQPWDGREYGLWLPNLSLQISSPLAVTVVPQALLEGPVCGREEQGRRA